MTDDLLRRVRSRLVESGGTPATGADVARLVRDESRLGAVAEVAAAVRAVDADVRGLGLLESVLRDPAVTDVLVNSPDEVWVDGAGGLRRARVRFADDDTVRRFAQRLLAMSGRTVDVAHPFADARLPGGIRMHVVVPPIAARTVLSFRVLRRNVFTMEELIAAGTCDERTAAVLVSAVAGRLSFLVTGGTGAGKTTLLATLLGLVPPSQRVVVVEDTAEIPPSAAHAVHLEARAPNGEGAGAVTMSDLVRQALRMRPDRVVVGEARGPEVLVLLAALNTGHAGSASTVHANRPEDLPARMLALGAMAGAEPAAVERQLVAGLDVVVHVARASDGSRIVSSIGVLADADGRVTVVPALWRRPGEAAVEGPGWAQLDERLSAP